jgi:isochorismate synthase
MKPIQPVFKCSFPGQVDWVEGKLLDAKSNLGAMLTIQPFHGSLKKFRFQEVEAVDFQLAEREEKQPFCITAGEYMDKVEKARAACAMNLTKVVLSRSLELKLTNIHVNDILLNLRKAFPWAFVYALQTEEYGLWVGATPEILVKKKGSQFETMSLAGTKWGDDEFTEKEKIEQSVVTQSILSDLDLSSNHASDPEQVNFGKIRHLQSTVRWQSFETLSEVSKKLHPTPAVCGLPKAAAVDFINQAEGYDRDLYTGYLQVEGLTENDISFVNLRCMQLFRNRIRFYIGGGINSLSDPESEWIETEKKLETLLDAIKIER